LASAIPASVTLAWPKNPSLKVHDPHRLLAMGDSPRGAGLLQAFQGGFCMIRRILAVLFCAVVFGLWVNTRPAQAQEAYGRQWVSSYSTQDWDRFYHYPYVYYPQNFWGDEYYRSSESLYYRYPPEMRIPVYNKQWHNEYPQSAQWNKWMHYSDGPGEARYHWGHHFILDTF
jgi:hypothetical protein